MGQYAQVHDASTIVVNIITWDGNTDVESGGWECPPGYTMVNVGALDRLPVDAACGVGWTYDGTTFSPPPSGPPPEAAA